MQRKIVMNGARPRTSSRLAWFFAGSFVLAWIPWLAVILVKGMPARLALVGLYAPALSALTVAGMSDGRREVAAILARLLRFHFKLRWWLLAMLVMPATYGAAALLTPGQQLHLLLNPSSWWFLPLSFMYLVVATAGEEIGWRGYALPLLLETRMPPTVAATVLGVIWGVWHIPLRIPSGLGAFSLPLFIVFTASLSVVYLVLLQRSGGSLIPALLLHASTDLAPRIIDISKLDWRFWLVAVIVLLTIAALLSIFASQPNRPRSSARRFVEATAERLGFKISEAQYPR